VRWKLGFWSLASLHPLLQRRWPLCRPARLIATDNHNCSFKTNLYNGFKCGTATKHSTGREHTGILAILEVGKGNGSFVSIGRVLRVSDGVTITGPVQGNQQVVGSNPTVSLHCGSTSSRIRARHGLQGVSNSYGARFDLFEQGLRQLEQKTVGIQSTEF
jgi:hypothetical protein